MDPILDIARRHGLAVIERRGAQPSRLVPARKIAPYPGDGVQFLRDEEPSDAEAGC